MMLPNIETFIGCESSFEEASIVLYGAPFDSTTSFRPGARFGPSAMRHESFGLETYSPDTDCRSPDQSSHGAWLMGQIGHPDENLL